MLNPVSCDKFHLSKVKGHFLVYLFIVAEIVDKITASTSLIAILLAGVGLLKKAIGAIWPFHL